MNHDAHKSRAPLDLPVHFHHMSTAISNKYELYPLDLNISNYQQRLSWLQHAPDFAKKKIRTKRKETSEYVSLTQVKWFWRLEPVESKRGVLRDIEYDAGIPDSFAQLKLWIRQNRYKNTILKNLKIIENPETNLNELSSIHLRSVNEIDESYKENSFEEASKTQVLICLPDKNFTELGPYLTKLWVGKEYKSLQDFFALKETEIAWARNEILSQIGALQEHVPVQLRNQFFRGGFCDWGAFSSVILASGVASQKHSLPTLMQLRALIIFMIKAGPMCKLDSIIMAMREELYIHMRTYDEDDKVRLSESRHNPIDYEGEEQYSPILCFFLIMCATIDLSQSQFENFLRKISESEKLSSPDDLTIKIFLSQRDQFSELIDEKRGSASIFDIDIWKDAYREAPSDHCNKYKTLLANSLAVHGRSLPKTEIPKATFRNSVFQDKQNIEKSEQEDESTINYVGNLNEQECVVEILRLQNQGPGWRRKRQNLRRRLNRKFNWSPEDLDGRFGGNPNQRKSWNSNKNQRKPTQGWGNRNSPKRGQQKFNNMSNNEDSGTQGNSEAPNPEDYENSAEYYRMMADFIESQKQWSEKNNNLNFLKNIILKKFHRKKGHKSTLVKKRKKKTLYKYAKIRNLKNFFRFDSTEERKNEKDLYFRSLTKTDFNKFTDRKVMSKSPAILARIGSEGQVLPAHVSAARRK